MKSIMRHDFAVTPSIDAPRSSFDMSHGHKTTMDSDWLIPVYWQETLPGDTINVNATMFARLNTPTFPLMDNARLTSFFFHAPYRILWDNWRKFCGEQIDPGDSIAYSIPTLEGANASDPEADLTTDAGRNAALLNYMGVPDTIAPDNVDIAATPFRAYSRIINEWFRDQNLIDSNDAGQRTGDGTDDQDVAAERHMLHRRGKRHDYFTQALPWPQKGTAVSLPIGTTAPIMHNTTIGGGTMSVENTNGSGRLIDSGTAIITDATAATAPLLADLSSATASTINDLREAFQTQKLLERDARSGTRYPEIIRNHFGVSFYDASYRPEYLGGASSELIINPVANTGGNASFPGQADLGAYGTIAGSNHGFSKTFTEHGIVMCLVAITADLTYSKGLNRFFSHSTRYDKYWPSLAHLGEQALLNKELYCQGLAADDDVFGYVPRYDEYRHNPSKITGLFQHTATASLDAWHLSQEFSSLPTLGSTFIESNTPFDRVVSTPAEPHFIFDSYFSIKAARPIPTFGTPGMIDHF